MSRRPELRTGNDRRAAQRRADERLEDTARARERLATIAEIRRITSEIDPAIPHIARVVHPRLQADWRRGSELLDRLERLA